MRRIARLVTLVLAVSGVGVGGAARAENPPGPWDTARDPEIARRHALHVAVREALASERPSLFFPLPGPGALERARDLLEAGGAEASSDPLLRFDLGEVYADLGHTARAIEVLRAALRDDPEHPAALDAYVTLANAYAHLDQAAEEREVYERYLTRVTSDRSRTMALLNLAEAEMHLGDLEAACDRYRDAIRVSSTLPNVVELEDNTGTLAVWGLVVALDRAGDVAGAAREVRLAVQLDPTLQIVDPKRNPSVFFAPAHEVDWYLGLGDEELARRADDPRAALELARSAEAHWAHYVRSSTAPGPPDRWLAQARARLARAKAAREAAEKRAPASRKAPPDAQLPP